MTTKPKCAIFTCYFNTIMRIAMIGQKGIPALYGGIERHVEELSVELARQGHEVLVYARSWYTPEMIKDCRGVKVVHLPSIHSKHLDAITHTLLATLHAIRQKPQVIHYHGVGPSLLSWLPKILAPKIKIVATFHCIDRYHQKWNWLAKGILHLGEKTACLFPHHTISVSKTIENYCQNEYNHSTVYIPNGIDSENFPASSSLLYQWQLEPNKYLLAVTRLVKHKGIHYLIKAWQIARENYPKLLSNYKLAIVGDSAFTDSYVNELKKMAGNDQSIVFTGWQHGQTLAELYGNATIMIHPSENEGLSLSVLRAMSLAKPVLVSDIPEQKELIEDGRFWFANTSISSLAYKIIELLQNPDWLKEAGKKNQFIASKKYNWLDIAKQTERIYLDQNKKQTVHELQTANI